MCEVLARERGADADGMFTVGLFSVLDALFDRPLERILAELSLSSHIRDALLFGLGTAGSILHDVVLQEQGCWDESMTPGSKAGLTHTWLDALQWSQSMLRTLGLATDARSPAPVPVQPGSIFGGR
jgi:EAL and modified HD-GYP domain-containing signal transduction protein